MRSHLLHSALALMVLGIALTSAAQAEPAAEAAPEAQTANREVLHQALVEDRIATGKPKPRVSLYLNDLGIAFGHWLRAGLVDILPGVTRFFGPMTDPILKFLLALLTLVISGYLIRYLAMGWLARPPAETAPIRQLPAEGPKPALHDWDSELRQRLAGDDPRAATFALWWWLAHRLVGERAEASWTGRELLAKAGRYDLLPGIRRLDRLLYGHREPSTRDVELLWLDLKAATA